MIDNGEREWSFGSGEWSFGSGEWALGVKRRVNVWEAVQGERMHASSASGNDDAWRGGATMKMRPS